VINKKIRHLYEVCTDAGKPALITGGEEHRFDLSVKRSPLLKVFLLLMR